jgi:hypothetical protein
VADNKVLADIVRKGGGKLLNAAVDTLLPGDAEKPAAKKRKSLLGGLAGAAAVRVATRSVPGAIVVGGAMLAKRLYDKRHSGKNGAKDAGKAAPKA